MDRSLAPNHPAPGRPWLLELAATADQGVPAQSDALPADTLGLAFSGGGIRSASFCLGVLQSLARSGWLRHVDYLSTVSGGGYVGSFLGRYFDTLRGARGEPDPPPGAVQNSVAQGLIDPDSETVDWLRRHSNYLAPDGTSDWAVNLAGFTRNLLSIHVVLGAFFFAIFGILNALRYAHPTGQLASLAATVVSAASPLTSAFPETWAGPWLRLAETSLWLALLPLMLAYWLVSEDHPEAFVVATLLAATIVAAAVMLATNSPLAVVVLGAAVIWAMLSWASVRDTEGPADLFSPFRLGLAREQLTRWLAVWLVITIGLGAFGAIDGVGRWLFLWMAEGGLTTSNVARWLASTASTAFASTAMIRMAVRFLAPRMASVVGFGVSFLVWMLVLVVGIIPPLVGLSFASHLAYEGGGFYARGVAASSIALVVSLLFGTRQSVQFVNRSGPMGIYATRLARTFLGAVNPARRLHPEGQDVTRTMAGDDVPFERYHPERVGGPLHLINCTVNQTVDVASYRSVRDRQAMNLAVGPAAVSIDRHWHALWSGGQSRAGNLKSVEVDGPDPFLGLEPGSVATEALTLRDWVAISGAALAPGMGAGTDLAPSVLTTLTNARLGHWWDSGLDSNGRQGIPVRVGPVHAIVAGIRRLFRAQWLLMAELTGRFGGPWLRHWYLSDGGFFDVTAAYELLRRRLPCVILCDADEDALRQGASLARLVEIARVDLGAEIAEVDSAQEALVDLGVPADVADWIGSLADLKTKPGEPSLTHAALLRVRHPEPPPGAGPDPWLGRRCTWILYIKASLTGDEPADVLGYAAAHPDFPNESTLDQLFTEVQWESYRRLGEHAGDPLFATLKKCSV